MNRENRVVAAKEGLSVLIGLDDRVQEALENIINNHRKLIPGCRLFECWDCGKEWEERSRDCHSPFVSTCPDCWSDNQPHTCEEHPEWPVDKSGNLI